MGISSDTLLDWHHIFCFSTHQTLSLQCKLLLIRLSVSISLSRSCLSTCTRHCRKWCSLYDIAILVKSVSVRNAVTWPICVYRQSYIYVSAGGVEAGDEAMPHEATADSERGIPRPYDSSTRRRQHRNQSHKSHREEHYDTLVSVHAFALLLMSGSYHSLGSFFRVFVACSSFAFLRPFSLPYLSLSCFSLLQIDAKAETESLWSFNFNFFSRFCQ